MGVCHAQRRADGSYTCDNCKASWDADDEAPCQNAARIEEKQLVLGPEYKPPTPVVIEVPRQELVIGYGPQPSSADETIGVPVVALDIGAPDSERTVFSFPAELEAIAA